MRVNKSEARCWIERGREKERESRKSRHLPLFQESKKIKKNRADEQIKHTSQIGQIRRADQTSRSDEQIRSDVRALARTLQTRCLDILLRSLAQGRTVQKPPQSRNNAKPASEKSPASLSPLQSPRPASLGEKSRATSSAYMAKRV